MLTMRFADMENLCVELDSTALKNLLTHYEKNCAIIRNRIADVDARKKMQEDGERRSNVVAATPEIVAMYIRQGMPYPAAIEAVYHASGVPVLTLEFHYKKWLKQKEGTAAMAQAAMILKMRRDGHGNAAIAAHIGVHEKSIPRMLRRALDKD